MKREELIVKAKTFIANHEYKGIKSNHLSAILMADFVLSLSPPAVKESEKPMEAEAFVIQKYGENWLNIMWSPEDVLDAMEEYASKPTVEGEKREMFEKVYVTTVEDLPKDEGYYFVMHIEDDGKDVYYFLPSEDDLIREWITKVEWWLRPVE